MVYTLQIVCQLLIFYYVIINCRVNASQIPGRAKMDDLFETESALIGELDVFIKTQEEKIAKLKERSSHFKQIHKSANNDILSYLSSPINGFLLSKRLLVDWKEIEKVLTRNDDGYFLDDMATARVTLKFPTATDLNDAAMVIIRYQDKYNLATSKIASGELGGVRNGTRMSASDCFELGRQAHLNKDFNHSELWMREALDLLPKEKIETTLHREDILAYLPYDKALYSGGAMGALNRFWGNGVYKNAILLPLFSILLRYLTVVSII